MISKTHLSRILIASFMVAFISSCNEPAQSTHTGISPDAEQVSGTEHKGSKPPEDIAPRTTDTQNSRTQITQTPVAKPALNLSIEGLTDNEADIENHTDRHFTDSTEEQAQKLTRKKTDDGVKLSGKLFTDQGMIDNKQYLDSVDGIQVNIEGNFR